MFIIPQIANCTHCMPLNTIGANLACRITGATYSRNNISLSDGVGKIGNCIVSTQPTDATNNHINLGNAFSIGNDFTVSMLVNFSSSALFRNWLFGHGGTAVNGKVDLLAYAPSGFKPLLQIHNGTAYSGVLGSTVLTTGKWYWLTFSKIGDTGYVYLDGKLDNSGALGSGFVSTNNQTYILRQVASPPYCTAGSMQHFMSWNIGLTEKEVAIMYQSIKGAFLI